MLKIIEDRVGCHDILIAPCDSALYEQRYGIVGHPNCLDNLAAALAQHGPAHLMRGWTYQSGARLERLSSDKRLQPRDQRFQLAKHLLSANRALVASSAPDQKTVSKHLTKHRRS